MLACLAARQRDRLPRLVVGGAGHRPARRRASSARRHRHPARAARRHAFTLLRAVLLHELAHVRRRDGHRSRIVQLVAVVRCSSSGRSLGIAEPPPRPRARGPRRRWVGARRRPAVAPGVRAAARQHGEAARRRRTAASRAGTGPHHARRARLRRARRRPTARAHRRRQRGRPRSRGSRSSRLGGARTAAAHAAIARSCALLDPARDADCTSRSIPRPISTATAPCSPRRGRATLQAELRKRGQPAAQGSRTGLPRRGAHRIDPRGRGVRRRAALLQFRINSRWTTPPPSSNDQTCHSSRRTHGECHED